MSINVKWSRDCEFTVSTQSGFKFNIDANSKTAPCPTEVLLSALGACSATDVVLILQEQGFSIDSLENQVTYTLTDDEPRLYQTANLEFAVKAEGISEVDILSAAQAAISKHCHVCLMLKPQIDISYSAKVL
jgi:putative redox protein